MNRSRFAYSLNAIHYCIWLNDIKFGDFLRKFSGAFMSLVLTICFTKKFKRRQEERMAKMQKIMNKFYYDKEVGYHIGWANHWFGYFYSGYPVVLSFILSGIVFRYWGMVNKIIILCIIGIPILICYIPAYKAVFSNDIYLKYFKEFEKEDEQWHKKWKRRTWLFCIGGCLMTIVGVACMWVVLLM